MESNPNKGASKYRSDIDGLRAVAVLSVLFFHAEFSAFAGGFVGVDVFFVISGYLITRLIVEEIDKTGSFKFKDFYIRRFKRLFPALFVMLFLSFICAYLLFSPQHFERLSKVLLFSLVSFSNIFFWNEAGYFGTESAFKPLLHTWSLSVEEQFYFFWPPLLYLLFVRGKKYRPVVVLLAVGLFSFLLNIILFNEENYLGQKMNISMFSENGKSESAAFFLMPFRIFEFVLGAMLVWFTLDGAKERLINSVLFVIGLVLIIIAVFQFSEETAFPSYNALLPCLGAAIVIYAGPGRYTRVLLSNRLMVGIGKLSYSLYLVHWPIIVFYKYWKFDALTTTDKYLLCVVSFLFAFFLNKFVEKPLRYSKLTRVTRSSRLAIVGSCAVVAGLFLTSMHVWNNGGWAWRLPHEIRHALSQDWNNQSKQTQKIAKELAIKHVDAGKNKRILFIGDSFMGDLVGAMSVPMENKGFVIDAFNFDDQCLPYLNNYGADIPKSNINKCSPVFKKISLLEKKLVNVDVVVFHSRWQSKNIKHLEDFLRFCDKFANKKCPLVVLGSRAEWLHVPTMVAKMHSRFDISSVNSLAYNKRLVWRYHKHRKALEHHTRKLAIPYVDLVSKMCSDTDAQCQILDRQKNILIYDHGHWTLAGQSYYGNLIADSGEFKMALAKALH